MKRRLFAFALLLGLPALFLGRAAPKSDSVPPAGERRIAAFTLNDPRDGRDVSLSDYKDRKAVVVVFLGTECPVNNAFLSVLASLQEEYAPKGVQFLGINANRQDSPRQVAEHARTFAAPFPILKDPGNVVADLFDARRTPEAFVLDGSRKVVYQGRIDDQFGVGYGRPGKPTRRDLAEALDEVLAGKPVSRPSTPVAGCLIGRVATANEEGPVTYARDVSRILQQKCQDCHRPGRSGPMPLLSYDDAAAWAGAIREAVDERRMPPWHADPQFGKFANDRSLSKEDRETLLKWIDVGTPRGDDADLPPPRSFPAGWAMGEPDVVFTMPRPFEVPAEAPAGGVPYKYFTVPTNFTEDRWVERAEVRAGAAAVVHHVILFIVPRGEWFRPDGPGNVLCGTAPGDTPLVLEPGLAKKVPAGARLVFQMHYTPNGKACTDQTSVGLIFAKEPPKHRVLTRAIVNKAFYAHAETIPAGAEDYQMEADYTFSKDAHLIAFMPHMHLRGKDFRIEAVRPGGARETLLSVPRYQFGWQTLYRCVEPVAAPKGTILHCTAHFDNSKKNPNNPDPNSDVSWGDQTWEEMMIGWVDYYLDDAAP